MDCFQVSVLSFSPLTQIQCIRWRLVLKHSYQATKNKHKNLSMQDRDFIIVSIHSFTHTHTCLIFLPSPFIHPPTHTPVATANPKPCHNRERVTVQIRITSSLHITQKGKDKKALQSITAHGTSLSSHHWHLGERLAEGGRRGGWVDIFCHIPSWD